MLPRHQPQPRGQLAARVEGCGVTDSGHQCTGGNRANPWHLLEFATLLLALVPLENLLLQLADLTIQFFDVPSEAGKEVPHGS